MNPKTTQSLQMGQGDLSSLRGFLHPGRLGLPFVLIPLLPFLMSGGTSPPLGPTGHFCSAAAPSTVGQGPCAPPGRGTWSLTMAQAGGVGGRERVALQKDGFHAAGSRGNFSIASIVPFLCQGGVWIQLPHPALSPVPCSLGLTPGARSA